MGRGWMVNGKGADIYISSGYHAKFGPIIAQFWAEIIKFRLKTGLRWVYFQIGISGTNRGNKVLIQLLLITEWSQEKSENNLA